MKKLLPLLALMLLPLSTAMANCDLTRFRWECDLPMKLQPSPSAHSLVYCGMTFGYLTQREYEILSRYHRRSVNMVLKVDGEMIEAPCIPADKFYNQAHLVNVMGTK